MTTSSQIPSVVNLQRKVAIDLSLVREFCERIQERVEEVSTHPFVVAFVSDRRMKTLNSTFRGKDSTTDVLSFPHEPDSLDPANDTLGDIVISAEQAERQAAENGLDLESEVNQLVLHGVLHLCGYDHETDSGEMDKRELKLRKELGI
jgi:probable rRNA maturation factor